MKFSNGKWTIELQEVDPTTEPFPSGLTLTISYDGMPIATVDPSENINLRILLSNVSDVVNIWAQGKGDQPQPTAGAPKKKKLFSHGDALHYTPHAFAGPVPPGSPVDDYDPTP